MKTLQEFLSEAKGFDVTTQDTDGKVKGKSKGSYPKFTKAKASKDFDATRPEDKGKPIKSFGRVVGLSAMKGGEGFVIVDKGKKPNQDRYGMYLVNKQMKVTRGFGSHASANGAVKWAKNRGWTVELND